MNVPNELTTSQKLILLSRATWEYKEVMCYFHCCQQSAYRLMEKARKEKNGSVRFCKNKVLVDSLLQLNGTTREGEIIDLMRIKELESQEKDEERK